jgi:ATP-dependent Clp protease protease subunit
MLTAFAMARNLLCSPDNPTIRKTMHQSAISRIFLALSPLILTLPVIAEDSKPQPMPMRIEPEKAPAELAVAKASPVATTPEKAASSAATATTAASPTAMPAATASAPGTPASAPAPAPGSGPSFAPTPIPDDESKKELSRLMFERDRLMVENAIQREKLVKELASRRMELERQNLDLEEQRAKVAREIEEMRIAADREQAKLKAENERLSLENSIAKAKSDLRMTELRMEETEARREITRLSTLLEGKDKEIAAAQYATRAQPVYLENPHCDNKLVISDRRIALNGPIVSRTAEEIADRIDYYNNKDPKLPIFIVIDNSPGGSVMAGYKILRAMDGSKAPVYVVVKQFAASMAACITTLADKSFAYPNAQILHHQLSSMAFGNLTQQRESLKEIEEWWERLAGPISQKMGISMEEFIKQMYSKVSTGDWTEFADNAQKLKWVDVVVNDIQETGIVKHPDLTPAPATPQRSITILPNGSKVETVPFLTECLDEKGNPFMMLPRPNPKDVYYLYNPDQYYRVP